MCSDNIVTTRKQTSCGCYSSCSSDLSIAMAECISAEHRALIRVMDKMTSEIAADPLTVASKLAAKELIPPITVSSAQMQAKEKELKASEIVTQVCDKVKTFPENFAVFLGVLDELPWMKQLAKSIREEFKKIRSGVSSKQASQPKLCKAQYTNQLLLLIAFCIL